MRRDSPGFDFSARMRAFCVDLVARVPRLSHICMDSVCVAFRQTRARGTHGIYASLTPLRFAGGARETVRRGVRYRLEGVRNQQDVDYLYLLNFYLPRFLNLSFGQKLLTTAHELWHIGPAFDGDMRRFPGRCYAHSRSKEGFDEDSDEIVKAYLATRPAEECYGWLRLDMDALAATHGRIYGSKVVQPRLVPIEPAGPRTLVRITRPT